MLRHLLLISAIVGSLLLFSLSTDHLFVFHSLLLAGGILCLSYNFNDRFIASHRNYRQNVTVPNDWHLFACNCRDLVCNVIIQCILAFCYNQLVLGIRTEHNRQIYTSKWSACVLFVLPIALSRAGRWIPDSIIRKLALFSVSVAGLDLQVSLVTRFMDVVNTIGGHLIAAQTTIVAGGLQFFIEIQWNRLHVPSVLRVFWISRTVFHFLSNVIISVLKSNVDIRTVFIPSLMAALSSSCENWLSLLGMASVISKACRFSDALVMLVSGTNAHAGHDDHDVGTLSAILFVILAFQTGLSSIEAPARLLRLFRNICLIVVAVMQSQHAVVHSQLMSLGAGQNIHVIRHVRALALAAFLAVTPAVFVWWLWTTEGKADTWLLALTALSAEIIIKVIVSVLTYVLFVIDSLRSSFWNNFDDYVYVVQSVGNTIEFLIGIFLFVNGIWKLLFESGGAIRAMMMCLHAYFNIFQQAIKGWQTFLRRQGAAKKVGLLPVATERQIAERDDVCPICYHLFNGCARVTNCGHLFHDVCLRKWLYIKDVCPLCHQSIVASSSSEAAASEEGT